MANQNKSGPTRLRLNMAVAKGLETPVDRDREYIYDTEAPGLALCVTRKGSRTWYWYGRAGGRPHREKLGRFPAMTVEAARKKATAFAGQVAEGKTAVQAKRGTAGPLTLQEAFDRLQTNPSGKAKRQLKPKTLSDYRYNYDRHLKDWAKRRLDKIEASEADELHTKIGKQCGPIAANRAIALFSTIYGTAKDMGYTGTNPAVGVKKFPERKRDRFLEEEELPAFLRAVDEEPNAVWRDWFLLALFTAARRGNVCSAAWNDINMDRALWTIPVTKTGEMQQVPLSAPAMAVLERRANATGGEGHVFPGRRGSGHVNEPRGVKERICAAAGIKDFVVHDLRRTAATYATKAGVSYPVVKKILGHALDKDDVTAIYARVDLVGLRDGLERMAEKICEVGEWNPETGAAGAKTFVEAEGWARGQINDK